MTPWTVAHLAPLSMKFSRQEYWSELPFPSPGDLPDPGIKPRSPALQADSLPTELLGKPPRKRSGQGFWFEQTDGGGVIYWQEKTSKYWSRGEKESRVLLDMPRHPNSGRSSLEKRCRLKVKIPKLLPCNQCVKLWIKDRTWKVQGGRHNSAAEKQIMMKTKRCPSHHITREATGRRLTNNLRGVVYIKE